MKFLLRYVMPVSALLLFLGCQGRPSENPPIHLNPNMDDQPKFEAMEKSKFFLDKAAMRMPVEGTVARGQLNEDTAYFHGKDADGKFVKKAPVPYSTEIMNHGRQRFEIYCAPCHGSTGDGQGIVVKKGFMPPPSFHIDRLRQVEDGYVFDVISRGVRNMPSYAYQIPVADRWSIVTYFRALQRSQNASAEDIPESIKANLK
ncbi:MAG: cytochrome c [Calditrichales bacterium]|nr:MAG: cytochrome c [Calditrichales bacterium]